YFITGNKTKSELQDGEQFSIPAGQFVLILTEEYLKIPTDKLGFITFRFGLKKKGLINVSGFHVDPGFEGNLVFAAYNAGAQPIILSRGADAFRLWLSELDGCAPRYKGTHFNQTCISDADVTGLAGYLASPAALDKQIEEIRQRLRTIRTVLLAVISPLLIAILIYVIQQFFTKEQTGKGGDHFMIQSPALSSPPTLIDANTAQKQVFTSPEDSTGAISDTANTKSE
ncbi:MAG: hypothetical protein IH914_01820, partial [candidate division Zixibacteria bacterium]|nr:hypothetical protein [candidate division Zixibacteria bacterium]